jgi:hypothetical protein
MHILSMRRPLSPAKPTLAIAGADADYMEITHCQDFRRMSEIGAHGWPQLSPSLERASEKSKRILLHLFVLQSKV